MIVRSRERLRIGALAVFLAIALSRLPFLSAGYGVNVDAWRVARVARAIGETGHYEVSRFPGYPLHEIVSSWFWKGGPVALNGLSAGMSVLACFAVWRFAHRLGYNSALLLMAALAATPAVFISSVTAKDYIWALAFAWIAMWMGIANKPIAAGLALGLAVGSRLTSAAMLLPVVLVLIGANRGRERWRSSLLTCAACVITAAICFLPVWGRYGWGFFTFYESHARPDVLTITLRATQEVWGTLGLVALALACAAAIWQGRRHPGEVAEDGGNPMVVPALLLIVLIYVTAYLRLPDQAAYLLPIVPAVLLLIARWTPPRVFQVACILIIIAPLVEFSSRGMRAGAIITDHREREKAISDVTRFVDFAETALPRESLVVVGAWEPMISVLRPATTVHNHYTYLANDDDIRRALSAGWEIAYTSPTIRQFNYRAKGVDLADYGAQDLRELLNQQRQSRK